MRIVFVFFLWLFLLVFVVASLYISFTDYLYERDKKIMSNIASFMMQVHSGEKRVSIPYPEETVIMFARKPAGSFVSTNVGSPIERNLYTQTTLRVEEGVLYMYVRKIDLQGYFRFVMNRPLYIGLITASLLLYVSIFFFTVREFQITHREPLTEELLSRIKALRLTLATLKLIPEESAEEMKRIVDSILAKKSSGK